MENLIDIRENLNCLLQAIICLTIIEETKTPLTEEINFFGCNHVQIYHTHTPNFIKFILK
jgi:hypothetical protein